MSEYKKLTVDISCNTGEFKYGATGFLYGLGDEGIPSDNMLAALKPQVTAQKPPEGLQHPNGDAFKVSPAFKRAGGKQVQIYIQDIYKNWPYDNLGMEDYLSKVEMVVKAVRENPLRDLYVYVPFNEPDWIWYNLNDKKQQLLKDWKRVYDRLRCLDPVGRIAGPNLQYYDYDFYSDFMVFCKNNHCLPDILTWHEIRDTFYHHWDAHYTHYREVEARLGIDKKEIVINEYARDKGDLGVPGRLVQYIAKFEKSKVYGCLAYWTTAGCLNDLVTWNNKATGGWWLYKWYGDMTGNTVEVTPPDWNADGLQGVAGIDGLRQQVRVIFGGAEGKVDICVKGFEGAGYFGGSVNAAVWEIDSSGQNPSSGPACKLEGSFDISGGQVNVAFEDMKRTAAYLMILSPGRHSSSTAVPNRYEAEYAALSGTAWVSASVGGYSGTGYVGGYDSKSGAGTEFTLTAEKDGFYKVTLRYSAGPFEGLSQDRTVRMLLNGSFLKEVHCSGTGDWNNWGEAATKIFLKAGINRIAYEACGAGRGSVINIDCIDVAAAQGNISIYEAEAACNTFEGAVSIMEDPNASGGKFVGKIGAGDENFLQFNKIAVSSPGLYRMAVRYSNGELGGGASNYNTNIVDRYAEISLNGGTARQVYFRNTLGWSNYYTAMVDLNLEKGENTIRFSNSSAGFAPSIDHIMIAAAYE